MTVLYKNVINLIFHKKEKKEKNFVPSRELNSRLLDYKSDALSTELLGQTSEKTQYNNKKLN